MEIKIELPDIGVEAIATLYTQRAPKVTAALYEALSVPLITHTRHACFSGHQVFCFLPSPPESLGVENNTLRSTPGDIMVFAAHRNEFAWMHDEHRMINGVAGDPLWELAINYAMTDLSHWADEGWHGSLVGRVTSGLDELALACARTLIAGSTSLRVSRAIGE